MMPTIQTLYDFASESPESYGYLMEVLEDFVHGQFNNFVGQTNVDLTNPCIAFDVDEQVVGKSDLASIIYIAFDCAYGLATSNKGFTDIFLDEVWKMMTNPDCAAQVGFMSKLIRGYGGAIITATQELNDFMESDYGGAVMNNAKTKIILNLELDEAKRVCEALSLTKHDLDNIVGFKRGQGLLLANSLRVLINIEGSELETRIFTTDKNLKLKYKQEREKEMQ